MNSKEYFFDQVIKEVQQEAGRPLRILELGCGTAPYVKTLIEMYPTLEYVGIEPIESSYKKAIQNLQNLKRAKVFFQLGYESIQDIPKESFDIVISFSVLEHVKQLPKFLALSAAYAKKGGLIVHRYDLGHALYPTNLKEKLHVWIGNTFPQLLPERTFVRYVPQKEVVALYNDLHKQTPYRYTYHQMPNAKLLAKSFEKQDIRRTALEEVYVWEFAHAATFALLETEVREQLFPTVAVWGKKA